MSTVGQPERATQDRVVALFRDELGYRHLGDWTDRSSSSNSNIEEALLSTWLTGRGHSAAQISIALYKLRTEAANQNRTLYGNNQAVYSLLRYGIPVKVEAGKVTETVRLIDWNNPGKNDFAIAEEVTLAGNHERRPDVVLYVNGIAIGMLELKNSRVTIGDGIRQCLSNQTPMFHEWFFSTVQFIFAGNDSEGLQYGSIGTPEKFFLKRKEDEADNSRFKLDKYLLKLCAKDRLIELMHDFVLFDGGIKKLPRAHQYFGVKAAQVRVLEKNGGIIWHTQGSGKSIVMVLLAKWILENNPNARVAIITDRDELDKQIERVFTDAGEAVMRTSSGRDLMRQLGQAKPRLLCSLIHKFGPPGARKTDEEFDQFVKELESAPSQTIGEVFVFVDECHRPAISWIGAIVLMFAAIVPSPPAKTFLAGLVAVSMNPIGMWIARARGIWNFESPTDALLMHFPDYLLLGVAVVISHVVTGLGQQVAKAREMGSYQLGELLGRGGMGEVYQATHRMLARPAAIKLIRPEVIGGGDPAAAQLAVARFRREAEAAAHLRSPHTVELYDFGVTDDETLYFVMELLDGLDLESLVRRHGPLPPGRVIHIRRQVCASLEEAHVRGLVHRDIKPANIHAGRVGLVDDFVKALDFGLVKPITNGTLDHSLGTQAGLVIGTPGYMAPEIALSAKVDGRADLYSLGCVAYYLLTGRQVFEGDTVMQVFAQYLQSAPMPPSQRGPFPVPAALEQLVLTCLAKNPEDRPPSAAELDRQLAAVDAVDVELWTDVHARQWWAATHASATDLGGAVETHLARGATGDSDTRLAVDLREASVAPKRPTQR